MKSKITWLVTVLFLSLTACATAPQLGKQTSYLFYKDVPYADYGDDIKLIVDIYDPDTLNAPVVLLIHGGGWDSRSGDMQGIAQDLARQGFLVYAATYRLVPKAIFPAQLDDMKNAVKFIQVDAPARSGNLNSIFVWGYSSGGYLAFMLGLNPENKIKGIVTGAAPTDFTEFPKSPQIAKFLGRSCAQDPKYWTLVSAVNNINEKSPPVFMYHGDDDGLVDIDQMFLMKEELEKKKVPVTARAVNGLGHVSLQLLDQKSVNQAIAFLLELARNGEAGVAAGTAPSSSTTAPTDAASGSSTAAPTGASSGSSTSAPEVGAPGASTSAPASAPAANMPAATTSADGTELNSSPAAPIKPAAKPKRKKRR